MLRVYFDQGGLMMWPLAVCSILLVAVIGERLITLLLRRTVGVSRRLLGGGRRPSTAAAKKGRRATQHRPSAQAGAEPTSAAPDRWRFAPQVHQRVLKFFWDIPPQLGLLGTVLGLVQIFQGELGAEAFGRGVGTACFTTVFGLIIAVIARVACYVFDGLGDAQASTIPQHPQPIAPQPETQP